MKRKNIDAAREARLWIRDIIVPAGMAALYIKSHPEIEMYLNDKWEHFANKFRKNPKVKVYPNYNK